MARTLLPLLMLVSSRAGKRARTSGKSSVFASRLFKGNSDKEEVDVCESVCANVVQNGLFHKKILRPDAVKHNLDPVNLFPSLSAARNKF